jgi:integrase
MAARRTRGQDTIFFDHEGAACTDPQRHRHCRGRWRGEISLGFDAAGKRLRRKVSGQTRAAVQDRLKKLHADLDAGLTRAAPLNYTLRAAAEDWLAHGLTGRSAKTIKKNQNVLEPILTAIGSRRLRDLEVTDVEAALAHMAGRYSTAAVAMGHNALTRAIRYAMARKRVVLNVAALAETPAGQAGRPSKSFTPAQVAALLKASAGTRMHPYIALCVGTGIRTEEARALRWDAVALDADLPHVQIWRSVRAHGDTKTQKSRRTLALPRLAAGALQAHRQRPDGQHELVFATRDGKPLDAANVRREFRAIVTAAGITGNWTPRELRHTGVSLLSLSGLPTEEIARIAGHTSTRTTEVVYRKELRPVIANGAQALDRLLGTAG